MQAVKIHSTESPPPNSMLKTVSPQPVPSPGSDISPRSRLPAQPTREGYFPPTPENVELADEADTAVVTEAAIGAEIVPTEALRPVLSDPSTSDQDRALHADNTPEGASLAGNTNQETNGATEDDHPVETTAEESKHDIASQATAQHESVADADKPIQQALGAEDATQVITEHSGRKSSITFATYLPTPRDGHQISEIVPARRGRKSPASSISFRQPPAPSLSLSDSQGPLARNRARSPPHQRFQKHVGFDNVPNGEATKHNTISLTLNVRHKGYQARRRSRTFMVGIDEHSYSDYAIQWLLDELVDDGDEIVCVRVIEKDVRFNDKQYQDDANQVLQGILSKNGDNHAVSFVLEYAVGKLHTTFQRLIQMYQPAMLIVGTRGRSLGGIQGLVNNRNSFSKYCLQYSPVPVVVVRPTEKRIKKKVKRTKDASRQTYVGMLAATHGKHEVDSEASSTYELEVQISPDEEAHQVARVLGLPAAFDPTIKPINPNGLSRGMSPAPSITRTNEDSPRSPGRLEVPSPSSAANSDEEEEEEEEEGEFEVMSGTQALDQQQKAEQLHEMEVGEAAALRMRMENDEEDDEDEPSGVKLAS